jgi:SAM-dependent methyltransferase
MDRSLYHAHQDSDRSHWWFKGRERILSDVFGRLRFPLRKRFLDIGSGGGGLLEVLLRHASTVTAVEGDAESLARIREKYGDRVTTIQSYAEGLQVEPGSYDVVTLFDVLEHIEDDQATLQKIYDRLPEGGVFVCTVPACPSLWSRHDELNHHFRRYTRTELAKKVRQAGFDIQKVTYFNSFLFAPTFLVRWTSRLLKKEGTDFEKGSGALNGVLASLFGAERFFLRYLRFPIGVSLLLVAQKPRSSDRVAELRESTRCADCGASLQGEDWRCVACGRLHRPAKMRPVDCLRAEERIAASGELDRDTENRFKNYFKQWPRLYRFLTILIAPVLFTGTTIQKFLRSFPTDARLLNVGSGSTREHTDVVNVDIFPFPNVDILAPGDRLPFQDDVFDAVCSEQVLEHVTRPLDVAREMIRVTKPGGLLYVSVPFIYPYHPSPGDYTRWTREGVREMMYGCEVVETGITMGPTSGMLVVLSMWFATFFSFGITPLRKTLNFLFMIVLTPLKLLDIVYAYLPGAEDVAAGVYIIARKK